MPAFEKAVELHADMIELDITLSRDKIPVVIHDRFLQRTTNGRGYVQQFTASELHELDAGGWFDRIYKNTKIPMLEDVLRWAADKICLNIEIKKEALTGALVGDITAILADMIHEYGVESQVVVSSFSHKAIKRFRGISSDIPTAMLLKSASSGSVRNIKKMEQLGASGINLSPRQMRESLMNGAAEQKIPVWVYTVDEEDEMMRCILNGCTGIFTNKPDVLSRVASTLLKSQTV